MSKKTGKRQNRKPDVTKEAGYYRLKTQAVKDLVEADESNSPEVSEEELNKYRSGPKIKLADGVKILILKFWFAGAVCFFFIWGLSGYMADMLDTLFVTAIAMGIVTDLLTNNAIRFFEATPGANDRYIMVTLRGYLSFFLNILYAFVVLFFVYSIYAVMKRGHDPTRCGSDHVRAFLSCGRSAADQMQTYNCRYREESTKSELRGFVYDKDPLSRKQFRLYGAAE